jgi:hypothetical protein
MYLVHPVEKAVVAGSLDLFEHHSNRNIILVNGKAGLLGIDGGGCMNKPCKDQQYCKPHNPLGFPQKFGARF